MPTKFVKYKGQLVPFASEEAATEFTARARGANEAEVEAVRAAYEPAEADPNLMGASAPPVVPSQPQLMTKDGKYRRIIPDDYQRAMEYGWEPASEEQLATAREIEGYRRPFGKSFVGEVGNKVAAAVVSGASNLLAPGAALAGGTGHEALIGLTAGVAEAFGAEIDVERAKKAVQYLERKNRIAALAGAVVPYALGGGAVAGATKGLGLGARAAAGAAEGLASGALAVREDDWIEDHEATASDVLMRALPSMILGGAIPVAGAAVKAGRTKLKDVFGEGVKKLRGNELPGEMAAKTGGKVQERLAGSLEDAIEGAFQRYNINSRQWIAKRAGRVGTRAAKQQARKDVIKLRKATLRDGRAVEVDGFEPKAIEEGAQRRLEWVKEVNEDLDDYVASAGLEFKFSNISSSLKSASKRGRGELYNESKDLIAAFREDLKRYIKETRPERKASDVVLEGDEMMALWRNAIQNARGKPGLAQAAEVLEDHMETALGKNGGAELRELLDTRRVAQMASRGAQDAVASFGKLEGMPSSISGALFQLGVGTFQRVTGLHRLSGASKQVSAAREAWDYLRRRVTHGYAARTYFEGNVVMNESIDNAALALLSKAKGFSLDKLNYAKLTGGAVTNSTAKALARGKAPMLSKFYDRDTDDDARFRRERDAVRQAATQMPRMLHQMGATLGDSADLHPKLSLNTGFQTTQAIGYLAAELPKGTPRGPGLPNAPYLPPHRSEMATFHRKFKAVMDPYSILEDLGNGRLSKESVDAVRKVYPGFYQRIVDGLFGYLGRYPAQLDPNVLAQIELATGLPGLLSQHSTPQFLATYAAAIQQANMPERDAGAEGGQKGLSKPGRPSGSPTLHQQMRSPISQAVDNIHTQS